MKHKLLSSFALAGAMFVSVSASAWDAPVAPAFPAYPSMPQYEGTWVTPEDGGTYYIYNVGTGQFLGCGQDWGTRAITTTAAILTPEDAEWSCAANKNTIIPFMLVRPSELEGNTEMADYWMIKNVNTNKSATDPYLCHEGNAGWIDGGDARRETDNNGYWNISSVGDDTYEFLPLDNQEGNTIVYGVHLNNLASINTSYTWTDLQNNASAAAKWKFVSTDDAESIRTYIEGVAANEDYTTSFNTYKENVAAYNEAMTLYNARLALYNSLLEAEKYSIDATEAGAVYTNAEATIEDLNAANTALLAAIKPAAIAEGCKNSSEENPFEVTNFAMTNADFSASCDNGKTPPGWTITITGLNIGQQNRTDTNPDTQQAITNFLEAWTPQPGTLGNGYAGQWVKGLPAGRYRLQMDATACQQSGALTNEELTGIYLFAGTGTYNFYDSENPVQTGEQRVTTFTYDFDFDADSLIVGLLVDNTNCNWISADNFHLYAIGAVKENPVKKGLMEAIAKAEVTEDQITPNDIEDAGGKANYNTAVVEAFKNAIETARQAVNGSSDEMKAAVTNLNAASEALTKSAATYAAYQAVYNTANEKAQMLDDLGQWDDLKIDIWDFADELKDAFNDGTLTDEGLADAQGKVDQMVVEYIGDGSKVQPGDDLTLLIKNADFSEGSGRDLTGDAVPGWTIVEGQLTELSPTYHNIERYHGSINIQQTIKNLPAGTYRIGVQGFVRIDGGDNDMVLYAGASDKKFMLITDEYSETRLLADPNNPDSDAWPYDSNNNVLGGYMPNSMQGAEVYFSTENPLTGKPFYLNEVDIAHVGGDLTIGVKCSATNLWILWDNFTLTYVSKDAILPILEQVQEYAAQLDELYTNIATIATRESADAIQERISASDNISTMDEALALLNDVKALMDGIKAEQAVYNQISELQEQYSTKVDEVGITDEAFIALLDEVSTNISNPGYGFQDKAEMEEDIKKLQEGWIPAVIAGKVAGDDVTAVINNPSFETGNINYWTISTKEEGDKIGDNQGFQNNSTYTSEDGEITLSNFVEAWRSAANLHDGDISQTFAVALPAGVYTLGVDGYAVNQSSNGGVREEGIEGAYLYAKIGEAVVKTSICVQAEAATPTHFEVTFYSNGTDITTIGLMVKGANFNWMAADNFTLTYQGTEIPDAVQGLATATGKAAQVFSLDGRQQSRISRGVNIVRMSDGSVRKVLVK